MFHEAAVLASEVVLSAYPLLIKKVDASVFLQTGVRMATFAGLAALGAAATGAPLLTGTTWGTVFGAGLLNILHVGASYTAFDALPAGNAMALFYTYPIWNVLGAAVTLGEAIDTANLPWMGLAAVGAFLLAQPSTAGWSALGVSAALLAAITETGIYLWFRANSTEESQEGPWTNMFRMYGGSLLLWGLLAIVGTFVIGKATTGAFASMFLFNAIVGFLGYALRFYMIPKVRTVTFSVLSFFGIVAAYLLGWLFVGEVPTAVQSLGAAAVIAANAVLLRA
jgi:drug/metabolite transporter (DMT)-like permease